MSSRIQKVRVDENESIKNKIDQTTDNDGVSKYHLGTAGVRAKLRDPKYKANQKFIGNQMGLGTMGEGYSSPAPTFKILGTYKPNLG